MNSCSTCIHWGHHHPDYKPGSSISENPTTKACGVLRENAGIFPGEDAPKGSGYIAGGDYAASPARLLTHASFGCILHAPIETEDAFSRATAAQEKKVAAFRPEPHSYHHPSQWVPVTYEELYALYGGELIYGHGATAGVVIGVRMSDLGNWPDTRTSYGGPTEALLGPVEIARLLRLRAAS